MNKKILKFYSPTCGPCKVMSNNLKEVTDATGIEVQEIDITDEAIQSILDEYKVRMVPTVVIVNSEGKTQEFKGVVSAQKIIEALNE